MNYLNITEATPAGQQIKITGNITMYKGKLQIKLKAEEQIEISS